MSLGKILLAVFIALTFILSFVIWKNKKFKKYENYGALLLFLSTLFGLAFLSFDKFLISTEHEEIFYFIELGVYVFVDLVMTVVYFVIINKKSNK